MFEIQDERIGHIKIFNVTEARANFADVLKEGNAKVVVTRHGRPTKILISYEEYLSLLGAEARKSAGSLVSEGMTAVPEILGHDEPSHPDKVNLPPKWVAREAEQIVSSLKGLFNK